MDVLHACMNMHVHLYLFSHQEVLGNRRQGHHMQLSKSSPHKPALQNGPGMEPENQPRHHEPMPGVPDMSPGWSLQFRGREFFFFLITGPPREITSCKLLGQRELVPNLNQGALCARVPFRREESTEIKPLPGGRAVHQAHRAE